MFYVPDTSVALRSLIQGIFFSSQLLIHKGGALQGCAWRSSLHALQCCCAGILHVTSCLALLPSTTLVQLCRCTSRSSQPCKLGILPKSSGFNSLCTGVCSKAHAMQVHTTPRQSRSFSAFKSELLGIILDTVERNGAEMPYPTSSMHTTTPPKAA